MLSERMRDGAARPGELVWGWAGEVQALEFRIQLALDVIDRLTEQGEVMGIGSQEWRMVDAEHPLLQSRVLSTRCGISAPGRSAGNAVLSSDLTGVYWYLRKSRAYYPARAEAAAASYLHTKEMIDDAVEWDMLTNPTGWYDD